MGLVGRGVGGSESAPRADLPGKANAMILVAARRAISCALVGLSVLAMKWSVVRASYACALALSLKRWSWSSFRASRIFAISGRLAQR